MSSYDLYKGKPVTELTKTQLQIAVSQLGRECERLKQERVTVRREPPFEYERLSKPSSQFWGRIAIAITVLYAIVCVAAFIALGIMRSS